MKPKTKLGQLSRGRRNKNTFDLNQNLKQFNVAAVMTLINSEFEAVVCGCLALSALVAAYQRLQSADDDATSLRRALT